MKRILITVTLIMMTLIAGAQNNDKNRDWAKFSRYAEDNAAVTVAPKVVFMGDSITEFWVNLDPDFFTSNNFIGRGISGQTSQHMLSRFQQDVIDLHPQVVVISAGTNDVAQNNGSILHENIVSQIKSMVELARFNGITPVVASVTPCNRFFWMPEAGPAQDIIALNKLIKAYTESAGVIYVDYHSEMMEPDGSLPQKYSTDGCHPVLEGYKKMETIVLPCIQKALELR